MEQDADNASAALRQLFSAVPAVPAPSNFERDVVARSLLHTLPQISAPQGFEQSVLDRVHSESTAEKPKDSQKVEQPASEPGYEPSMHSTQQPIGSTPSHVSGVFGGVASSFLARLSIAAGFSLLSFGAMWWWTSQHSGDANTSVQIPTQQGYSPSSSTTPRLDGASPTSTGSSIPSNTNAGASSSQDVRGTKPGNVGDTKNSVDQMTNGALNQKQADASRLSMKAAASKSARASAVNRHRDSLAHEHVIRGVDIPASRRDED